MFDTVIKHLKKDFLILRKVFIEDNVRFRNTDQYKHEFDKFLHIEKTRLKHRFIKLAELRAIIKINKKYKIKLTITRRIIRF